MQHIRNCESISTFLATSGQCFTAAPGSHSRTEAMCTGFSDFAGLVCSFHGISLSVVYECFGIKLMYCSPVFLDEPIFRQRSVKIRLAGLRVNSKTLRKGRNAQANADYQIRSLRAIAGKIRQLTLYDQNAPIYSHEGIHSYVMHPIRNALRIH